MELAQVASTLAADGVAPAHAAALYAAAFAPRGTVGAASLPRRAAAAAAARLCRDLPPLARRAGSADGTCKFYFQANDGARFEAVYLPEVVAGRGTHTLCISSQSGCSVGCRFCFTASLRRYRDLTAAEIVGQVVAARDALAADGAPLPTNVVFMGMGEPLLNAAAVTTACRILLAPHGLALAPRRVTVSTAGIVPQIAPLRRAVPVRLAVSLNAVDDATRSAIMPINRRYPLAELLQALRDTAVPRQRVTIEYVLLAGINDGLDAARALPALLAGLPVTVNLLPLNPHERTPFAPPGAATVAAFHAELRRAGLRVFTRRARGRDIGAACGQLGPTAAAPTLREQGASVGG